MIQPWTEIMIWPETKAKQKIKQKIDQNLKKHTHTHKNIKFSNKHRSNTKNMKNTMNIQIET